MFIKLISKYWQSFLGTLTRPSLELVGAEPRHRARILAALSLALLVAVLIVAPIWIITSPAFTTAPYIALGLLVTIYLVYRLSRTYLYRLGAFILIFLMFGLVISTIVLAPGTNIEKTLPLNYLVFGVLIANLFLGKLYSMITAGFSVVIIGSFFFVPDVPFDFVFSNLVFFALIVAVVQLTTRISEENRQRLVRSEERYRTALDASLDAFYVLQPVQDDAGAITDFRIIEANEKTLQQLSIGRTSAIGEQYSSVSPQHHSQLFDRFLEVIQTGNPLIHEYSIVDHDDTPHTFHVQLVKVREGIAIVNHEITASKQAEEALKNSEVNFRTLFNTINDFLFVLDMNGRIIEINQTVLTRLGYTPEELINQHVLFVHPKERRSEAAQIVADMLAGTRTYCPVPIQMKSGPLIPVETYITQGYWNGRPALFGVTKDISTLKISEEKFAAAFHANPALAGLSKVETGEYVEVNRTFCEKLGLTPAEVIGKKSTELLRLDNRYREKIIERLKHDGFVRDEEAIIYAKDGTPLSVLLSAQILNLHGVAYNFTTAVDITERKRTEVALTESEARLRALMTAIPDLVFRNHRDGTYLDYHAGSPGDMFVPPEQFLGRKIIEVMPTESAQRHMHYLSRVLETGQEQIYQYTLPMNGEVDDFEARMVTSGQDEALTIIRNITKLKQLQHQEFELALERERRQLLTSFIRNATHEFRTPLATIGSSAYILARSQDESQREERKHQIELEINRLTRLIEMMILMTKLENTESVCMEPINLHEELRYVCTEITHANPKHHLISCELDAQTPIIMGNSSYLATCFKQLIENAYHFTPEGGKIHITTRAAINHVEVRISDSGPGIAAHHLPHIFETFWRQDEAHSTPGFGLGLPITQKIVQMHQGKIEVESTPGAGTTFIVSLPTNDQFMHVEQP